MSCATTAGLNQFYPPTLNYSRATTSLFGSKTVIFVPYGSQLPLDLLPCPSLGMHNQLCLCFAWRAVASKECTDVASSTIACIFAKGTDAVC